MVKFIRIALIFFIANLHAQSTLDKILAKKQIDSLCQNITAANVDRIKEILKEYQSKYSKNYEIDSISTVSQANALNISFDEFLTEKALCECDGIESTLFWNCKSIFSEVEDAIFIRNGGFSKCGWHDEYSYSYEIYVPKQWQICNCYYDVIEKTENSKIYLTPIAWIQNDTENPPRFRGYKITLKSKGSRKIFKKKDGFVKISNVMIYAIKSDFKNGERAKRECSMPVRQIASFNQKTVKKTTFYPIEYSYFSKKDSFDVYVAAGGGTVLCNNWNKIGTVTPDNEVSVVIEPGQHKLIKVMKINSNKCDNKDRKRFDDIYLKKNNTKQNKYRFQISDNL